MNTEFRVYKHNPPHLFVADATYMITAATYEKRKFFKTEDSMELLLTTMFYYFKKYEWFVKAYIVLPNHYHILAVASNKDVSLPNIIKNIHKYTARRINEFDKVSKRKIWWNYWDSCITYESSYFARLNYIHFNAVKHGNVNDPMKWKFSSYNQFYDLDSKAAERIEENYHFEGVNVKDDF